MPEAGMSILKRHDEGLKDRQSGTSVDLAEVCDSRRWPH